MSKLVEQHLALCACARHLLVHAVDAAHHRRLAAARRPDDRRHLVGVEIEVDALDLLDVAVEGAQFLELTPAVRTLARASVGSRWRRPGGSVGAGFGWGRACRGWASRSAGWWQRSRLSLRSILGLSALAVVWAVPVLSVSVGVHPKLLLRASSRAKRLSRRIIATSVKAAPHARFTTDVVEM